MYQFLYDLAIHFGPAFFIGILHTVIPCEDKAIFFFWSSGISKTQKKKFLILLLYGLGLLFTNIIITNLSTLIAGIPLVIIPEFKLDPYLFSFLGGLSSTIFAIILFFFITRSNYTQKMHAKYKDTLLNLNWDRKSTPFFFGTIVGFAPCIFEFYIYSQGIILATTKGLIMGTIYVFYYGVGTFAGLLFIAIIKQGTSRFIRPTEQRKNTTFILMICIIIIFNTIIMCVSVLRINIYPGV